MLNNQDLSGFIIQKDSNGEVKLSDKDDKSITLDKIPTYENNIIPEGSSPFRISDYDGRRQKHHLDMQVLTKLFYQIGACLINSGYAYTERAATLVRTKDPELFKSTSANEKNPNYYPLLIYKILPNFIADRKLSNDIFRMYFPIIVALDHMQPQEIFELSKIIAEKGGMTVGLSPITLINKSSSYKDIIISNLLTIYIYNHKADFLDESYSSVLGYILDMNSDEVLDYYDYVLGMDTPEILTKKGTLLLDQLCSFRHTPRDNLNENFWPEAVNKINSIFMKPSEKSSEEKMSSEPMKAIYERFIAIQDPKNNKISCSLKNTKILDSSHKKIGQGIGGLQATISQQNQAMNDRIISYEPLMKKPKPLSPLSATHIHIQFKNLVK